MIRFVASAILAGIVIAAFYWTYIYISRLVWPDDT